MANNASINLVNLDFFNQKSNIKNYLREQNQFKDYDFDGSTMNVLLDILAYNTSLNLFYKNMLMTESWLDTAQTRGAVVSHAKELNYVPRSYKSAKARVKIEFTATSENQPYIIPKEATVSAIVKNSNFVFSVPETISVSSPNTSFSFETDLYEGIYVEDTYVFNQTNEDTISRFKISNKNIDTDSLEVTVYSDGSTEGNTYIKSATLLDLDYKSQVYFLQTSSDGYYEIYFGNNILGKKPSNYSTVVINYRLSAGTDGNNAQKFVLNFNPTGSENELTGTVNVTTISGSIGGANAESNESIRHNAPRSFQVQERTITARDYEIALKTEFPEINAVYAYGGELVNPPRYGRVFVAADIENVDGFPDSKKQEYYNFIKNRAPFTIEPIFVEPDYSYLSFDLNVRYNISTTKLSSASIETAVKNAVITYKENYLDSFGVAFRYSDLLSDIDEADNSIISSKMDVHLYKKIDLIPEEYQSIILNFNTPLIDNIPIKGLSYPTNDVKAMYSSRFTYFGQTCIFEDDGNGKVRIVTTNGNTNVKVTDVGTIDYASGTVTLNSVTVDKFEGSAVKIYVKTLDNDVSSKTNTILTIEDSEIDVEVEELRL
jgi:hypothetical protein